MNIVTIATIAIGCSLVVGAMVAVNAAPQPTPMVVEVLSEGKPVATIALPSGVGHFVVAEKPSPSATITLADGKEVTIAGKQIRISRDGDILTTGAP